MNIINISRHGKKRLVTAIEGMPFYLSVGHNSGYENTWFFFGGVLETEYHNHAAGLPIRPNSSHSNPTSLKKYFGESTLLFIQQNGIDKVVPIHRFGDLPKMCVSASIGGGFWDTKQGKLLHDFLIQKYNNYFVSDIQFNSIDKKNIKTVSKPKHINQWLRDNGVNYAGDVKLSKSLVSIKEHHHHHHYHHHHHHYFWEADTGSENPSSYKNQKAPSCLIL